MLKQTLQLLAVRIRGVHETRVRVVYPFHFLVQYNIH